jgi:hypothetical protein
MRLAASGEVILFGVQMNWRKEKNALILETGKRISFGFPIKGIIGSSGLTSLVITLDNFAESSDNENKYLVSKKEGTIEGKDFVKYPKPAIYPKDISLASPAKCTIDWAKQGEVLVLDNERQVKFDYPIGSIFETCGILIVVLDVPPEQIMTENVFGVSKQGEIIWQIETTPKTSYPCLTNRYVSVKDSSISGIAMVWNFNCTAVFIDVKTGKVVDTKFTK